MAPLDESITQLEAAIAAQDLLRPVLGDAAVDAVVTTLRARLDTLRAERPDALGESGGLSAEQLYARIQRHLPPELAAKMGATGRSGGERKQVTVLFADISGFTALGERLDPEDVVTLTNEVLKELAEAVYQYEGYIDKFVGDAIMAVFGAPVAHEDDPERALRTGLAMRERMERFNRRWIDRLGEPLDVHVGVNTGPVVAGNVGPDLRLSYTVMGDTVNTAARLVDVAPPGQILVSRSTYRLAQGAFTFVVHDSISVKGKREPLAAFELQRAKLLPNKSRGLGDLARAFVGREREMDRLRQVQRDLEDGHGSIVTITGEAGIGKSRLMAEWRAGIGERARWLEGRAFPHTRGLAFGPFLDLLRRYAGIKDEDSDAVAHRRLANTIDDLFPGDREAHAIFANLLGMRLTADEAAAIKPLSAETLRRRIFTLVEALFTRLARERPTIVIVEDMHWADRTSVEMVEHLLPLATRVPLTIVGVFRLQPGERPIGIEPMLETRHDARTVQISLPPLSSTSSLAMVEQLLDTDELPAIVNTAIVSKAEGNPFFVEEVIRSLIERGALIRSEDDRGWEATSLMGSLAVPDTLHGLLMARLDRLPDETKWVAQQAAVIGRIFLYRVLRYLSGGDSSLDLGLSQLEQEQVIREHLRHPEVEYIFKHALTQEVAYQSLLAPRRKNLHRKVGEAMEAIFAERLGEFRSILATHFSRAEVWDKAVDYLEQTGDAAARLFAHSEARLHYVDALAALAHLPATGETRRRRATVLTKLVSVAFAEDTPEQNLERLTEAESLIRDLLDSEESSDDDRLRLARVHYWMGRLLFFRNQMREATDYYRRVIAVGEEFGDEELVAIPSSAIGRTLVLQGQFGGAEPFLERALGPLAEAASWPEWVLTAGLVGASLAARGRCAEGLDEAQRALTRAQEIRSVSSVAISRLFLAFIYLTVGDPIKMLEESRQSVALAEQAGARLYTFFGSGFRSWATGRLGDFDAAIADMHRTIELGRGLGTDLVLAAWFAAAEAEIYLAAGQVQTAIARAADVVAIYRPRGNLFAEGLAERVWARGLARQGPSGLSQAEEHLAASIRAFEAGDARIEVARTHVVWGQVRRELRDHATAIAHFERAARQLAESGLIGELTEVNRQLAELERASEK